MTWTKSEIQNARKTPLAPLLIERGYELMPMPGQNYRVQGKKDLYVKEHYWQWKAENQHGNAIDFFIIVEEMTFADAMNILCPKE